MERVDAYGWRGDVALVLITAVWGVTFVTVKDALSGADTLSFLALRFAVGAIAAASVAGKRLTDRATVRNGAILAVFLFFGFILQTAGLRVTSPSRSAFITGLSVVLVPVAAYFLFRRPPRVASIIGIAFAVAGLYLLTGFGAGGGAGDLLTLGCTFAFAIHIALTERYAPKEGPMALVAVQLGGVALLCAACLPLSGGHVTWSWPFVAAVLFCGAIASALCIGVQTWAQARTTAVRAALIFALEPVFAAIYSVLVGRERLSMREVWGGALIVFGIVVAETGAFLWQRWRVV